MPMTTQDVSGAPDPHKVEWKYTKYFGRKKSDDKKKKDTIIRRAMSKAVRECKELEEVVDMNKQQGPDNWRVAKIIWNEMIKQGKVYPTDYEGLVTFERFYSTYMKSNKNKEPSVDDIIEKFISAR